MGMREEVCFAAECSRGMDWDDRFSFFTKSSSDNRVYSDYHNIWCGRVPTVKIDTAAV